MSGEPSVGAALSRRRLLLSGAAVAAAAGIGALTLDGCSAASAESGPASTPPPGLARLTEPVAYTTIPFSDGVKQPSGVRMMSADTFFAVKPQPSWEFVGDPDWNSVNGFKFRKLDGKTVILMADFVGHVAIVPVDPAAKSTVGPGDIIWQPAQQRTDNPHSPELVPAGPHRWKGGSAAAPNLLVVASEGDNLSTGSLTVYDLESSAEWSTPSIGAHGALWDPVAGRVWTIRTGMLESYALRRYTTKRAPGDVADHTGAGWGLGDHRIEFEFNGIGHDLQPDYSSKGTHLLISTPGEVFSVPKKAPGKALSLTFPVDAGESLAQATTDVKSIVRTASGLYLWIRAKAHDFNQKAVFEDTAIFVGKAAGPDGTVDPVATLSVLPGDWTYKARPFVTDYL